MSPAALGCWRNPELTGLGRGGFKARPGSLGGFVSLLGRELGRGDTSGFSSGPRAMQATPVCGVLNNAAMPAKISPGGRSLEPWAPFPRTGRSCWAGSALPLDLAPPPAEPGAAAMLQTGQYHCADPRSSKWR